MSTWDANDTLGKSGLPVPRPSDLSKPHWDACKRHELLVQRCGNCSSYLFPPAVVCTQCLSGTFSWVKSSGRGSIYSFTIVYRPQRPEFDTPYIVAIIELEEGWHMLSNIVDCDIAQVKIGLPVEVTFSPRGEHVLPMFKISALTG